MFEEQLIINHSKDWQLWRYEIKTGNKHAHFSSKSALDKFMRLIKDNEMPTSQHYITSARRLFNNDELMCLRIDVHKDSYHNKIKKLRQQRRVYKYR